MKRPWVKLFVAAWERLRVTNGNLYAAAITYFSFLALFPMLLLAVAVLGFVLHAHPDTLHSLFDKITANAPGQVGQTLKDSINSAVDARAAVGLIGLGGVLLTGLGWIANLRAALDAIWKRTPPKQNPVRQRLVNLGILVGLGVAVLVSLGITAGWAAFTSEILTALGLGNVPGMGTLLGIVGIAIALVADAVLFFFVLVRMPNVDVPPRVGIRGSLLAAVGFEVLKIVGTYTVSSFASSATAGPFASLLAVLVWIQLVSRWMLFSAAWTAEATLVHDLPEASVPVHREPSHEDADQPALSPATVGAALVGAGAVAGAAATAYGLRRKRTEHAS
ncbi:MAG TPA: YhjD/YihY/BrkB family envelope integrity protein [Jatrophihabitans sp.]|jgi:membrane protein